MNQTNKFQEIRFKTQMCYYKKKIGTTYIILAVINIVWLARLNSSVIKW